MDCMVRASRRRTFISVSRVSPYHGYMVDFIECQNLDQLITENTYTGTSLSAPRLHIHSMGTSKFRDVPTLLAAMTVVV